MKSVVEFNEQQKKDFRILADDVVGPTNTHYALLCLEAVANELSSPDLDPSWISDEETKEQYEVCMAALEYFRMYWAAQPERK